MQVIDYYNYLSHFFPSICNLFTDFAYVHCWILIFEDSSHFLLNNRYALGGRVTRMGALQSSLPEEEEEEEEGLAIVGWCSCGGVVIRSKDSVG